MHLVRIGFLVLGDEVLLDAMVVDMQGCVGMAVIALDQAHIAALGQKFRIMLNRIVQRIHTALAV